jgi:hypothetical protein
LLALVISTLACDGSAQVKKQKSGNKTKLETSNKKKPMNNKSSEKSAGGVKMLAEGFYSPIESPFIFVARSPETYAQIQSFVENLPSASTMDFSKTAVVAAFAGTKNTGGYSVIIKKTTDKIAIDVSTPPKDAMVTQVLTTPYNVSLVPVEEEMPFPIEVSANWKNAVQNYNITAGEFEYSGGFAGEVNKFTVEGTIDVLSFGSYATIIFNLSGKGAQKARKLTETASGSIKEGKINLVRLDAGSFSEGPKPPLKVSGTIANDKLALAFEPLPTIIADGYEARGKIEAVKIK